MASRFETLRKEINRGLKVDEKSGVVIRDWSPNNVRRLIIGTDCAVVCYHVTGGKFSSLVKVIEFGVDSSAECFEYHQGASNIKPLLSVLVDGRICSCIEEIVVCTRGYDTNMLSFDYDLSVLLSRKNDLTASALHSRFPRLHSIYSIDCTVADIFEHVRESKSANTLLYTTLIESGNNYNIKFDGVAADWWKGSFLRPQLYGMDAPDSPLARRFESVKQYYLNLERDVKVAKAMAKKYAKIREEFLPLYSVWSKAFYSLSEGCNSVYSGASLLEKTVWGSFLDNRKVEKTFNKLNEANVKQWKYIDFNQLRTILLATDDTEDSMSVDVSYLTLMYNLIEYGKLENIKEISDDVKKREYLSVEQSKALLKSASSNILNLYICLIFAAFVKNIGVNGAKYASVNYGRLTNVDASRINYDQGMVSIINKMLPETVNAGDVLGDIGATRVTAKALGLSEKLNSAFVILEILEKKE